MRVASLHIHPVKGMRAVSCESAQVTMRGFAGDRRWLITGGDDVFVTQRSFGGLAQIAATLTDSGVKIENNAGASIDVVVPQDNVRRPVQVWKDQVEVLYAGDEVAAWLSRELGFAARLYFMDEAAARTTNPHWASPAPMSFADAFPVLITTAASLDALNEAIAGNGGDPVTMERFRSNIVIEDTEPWADDFWRVVKIGDVVFDLVKPSDRCIVTTTDQKTGARMGKEPLKTLAKIRRSAHPDINGVLFGSNAIPRNKGDIRTGDAVEVLEERPEGWPLTSA